MHNDTIIKVNISKMERDVIEKYKLILGRFPPTENIADYNKLTNILKEIKKYTV